jgi:hypothetical protein
MVSVSTISEFIFDHHNGIIIQCCSLNYKVMVQILCCGDSAGRFSARLTISKHRCCSEIQLVQTLIHKKSANATT